MGFDNDGRWTSDFYPINDKDSGIAILSAKFQALIQENLKESFENCILRDGTGRPTSDINWNGQRLTNLGAGVSSGDAVNKGQLDSAITTATESLAKADLSNLTDEAKELFIPVGTIQMAPLASLPGYLICHGQAVSRSTYANLFAAIGVNFGIGDGITTFNLPDYRGAFFRGFDGGEYSAANMYTKQSASESMVDHYHVYGNCYLNNHGTEVTGSAENRTGQLIGSSGSYIITMSIGSQSYTSASSYTGNLSTSLQNTTETMAENRPVNYAINFFIKY